VNDDEIAAGSLVDRLAALEGKIKLELTVERMLPAEREVTPALDAGKD
jgi:hypothetical protein